MRLPEHIEAVVIGASAGGVQALTILLPALPAAAAAAILVVIHLPRDRPSFLAEALARRCSLTVREAYDKEPVLPGTVYFAPADYHLLVDEGPRLALSVDELVHHSRPSIDVLFESAAEIYRNRLLGIILTGANDDGAVGLAAVLDAGGLTIIQAPETAQSPRMVVAALRHRPAHRVMSLEGIATLLGTLHVGNGQISAD